ncbi:MAG: hypothetical protein ACP5D1_02280, partial [Bacteroidales bacterium]
IFTVFLSFGITGSLGSPVIPCGMFFKTRPVSAWRRRFLSAPAPYERWRSAGPAQIKRGSLA